MSKHYVSQSARLPVWLGLRALACWPLVASACSIYEPALLDGIAAPLGGGASGGGESVGGAASGATNGGTEAASGSAGSSDTAGMGGDMPSQGGSGGNAGGSGSSGGSSAGTGGTGGAPPVSDIVVIDDMEDGDAAINFDDGRNGYWYVGHDATPTATSDPESDKFSMLALPSGERSVYSAHLKAVGFKDWGSVIGFNFKELSGKVKPYDASAFCGVQYFAKAAAATSVRFRVPDVDTHADGGVCKVGGSAGQACYDHFGASAALTTSWKQYSVTFSALMQVGSGYHPADGKLKTDQLFALEWALPGNGNTYEIWIDDVTFTKCP